jgi:hypothetical protein
LKILHILTEFAVKELLNMPSSTFILVPPPYRT